MCFLEAVQEDETNSHLTADDGQDWNQCCWQPFRRNQRMIKEWIEKKTFSVKLRSAESRHELGTVPRLKGVPW
jgi:hypothetical protein